MTGHTLVVDDDEANADMLVAGLVDAGWRADAAAGVNEALEMLGRNSFTLVVSDIAMNDGDGFDLLRGIRANGYPLPVILMSSFGTAATSRHALESGAFAYLAKPFALADLVEVVRRAHALQHESDRRL